MQTTIIAVIPTMDMLYTLCATVILRFAFGTVLAAASTVFSLSVAARRVSRRLQPPACEGYYNRIRDDS